MQSTSMPGGEYPPGHAGESYRRTPDLTSPVWPYDSSIDGVYGTGALGDFALAMIELNLRVNGVQQDAINKLERQTVDDEILKAAGDPDCTICIEGLTKGDHIIYLPCKHYFHEECACTWLREHNTCPVCRAEIESWLTA